MTSTFATRQLDVNGTPVLLTIHHPKEQGEDNFLCLATIDGLEDERIEIPAGGVDVIQSLLMALAAAGERLESAGDVRWLGMDTSGLLTWNTQDSGARDRLTWSLTMPVTPEAEAFLSGSPA